MIMYAKHHVYLFMKEESYEEERLETAGWTGDKVIAVTLHGYTYISVITNYVCTVFTWLNAAATISLV